ncbi:Prp19/Pso4-like-domain-containing protein, partial [Dipodascopsis tothii]|uniref:Prp19/Pso4-like-domain-containing protein n=1 Tax=Dipodascopsis tothii TaxID=44089 RepID=UPI0034CD3A29
MICAISGAPPTAAVVSRKSGCVFERALIEAYIDQNGTDPISGEPLTTADLVTIDYKPTVGQTPALASLPAMLQAFQGEWDAKLKETLTLKQELVKAKQELSAALYHYDAAVRVASDLAAERDAARAEIIALSK